MPPATIWESISESRKIEVLRKPSLPHPEAIGFAVAGYTLWVLTDTSIQLAQYKLPADEVVTFSAS